ncbi:unnamed protein product [Calypogeia fissa]
MPEYVIKATHSCAIQEQSSHRLVVPDIYCHAVLPRLRELYPNVFKLPPSVPFELMYLDSSKDNIRIANGEDLVHALRYHVEASNHSDSLLSVNVVAKCSIPIVRVNHADSYYQFPRTGEERLCYDRLHGKIRNHFRIPSSAQVVYMYRNSNFPEQHMTVVNDEELEIVMAQESTDTLQLDIKVCQGPNEICSRPKIVRNQTYVVKVTYNGIVRRLTLVRGEMGFSFGEFRRSVRGLFTFPHFDKIILSYIDKDQDNITMGDDGDLVDALVFQSLHPLKVNVTMVERVESYNERRTFEALARSRDRLG